MSRALIVLFLFCCHGLSAARDFTLAFTSEEWALIGEPSMFRDDLVVMRDGTKLWGKLREVPTLQFAFGSVGFAPEAVSAVAYGRGGASDQVQIVTRDGEYYIGKGEFTKLQFDRKLRTGLNKYEEGEIDPNMVNFILMKRRGGGLPNIDEDVFSIVLADGQRFPARLGGGLIQLTDGWRDFTLDPDEIVDVRFQGGLQGYIKGEALHEQLRFAFVRDEDLPVELAWSGKQVKLPWGKIDQIRREGGDFVLSTPYLFSKWVPENMVYVPPGRLLIGSRDTNSKELLARIYRPRPVSRPAAKSSNINFLPTKGRPSAMVEMSGFFVDRYEVTCEEYAQFCQDTGHKAPGYWYDGKLPNGLERHPVVNITYDDAEAFARWAGKRLPTELEWERAAKGAAGYRYPYGPTYERELANTENSATKPVGSFEAKNLSYESGYRSYTQAIQDMSGNAAEWTASRFHHDRYTELLNGGVTDPPQGTLKSHFRVVRGGSFKSSSETATTNYRLPMAESDFNPTTGFRCVAEVNPHDVKSFVE